MSQDNNYFLLDSRDTPLAKGVLIGSLDAPVLQIRVLDDKIEDVMEHEKLRMVSLADGGPALLGRIVRSRNDIVIVEKLEMLDSDMRQNLRMPTRFTSFIYPLSGRWRGRRKILSKDLSCGGIAFYLDGELEIGEELEVVIPITSLPLILRCRILRKQPSDQVEGAIFYAAKFVDLCNDEEMVAREAVFSVQLQSRPKRAAQ